MLYQIQTNLKDSLHPFVHTLDFSHQTLSFLKDYYPPYNIWYSQAKWLYEIFKNYDKPLFNIQTVELSNKTYNVLEETIYSKAFCDLKKFSLDGKKHNKDILIVAPLSGHYSTLLRDTVKKCLEEFNVYLTDWLNPRDIPLSKGEFGFNDYVFYLIDFFKHIKDKEKKQSLTIMGVCQPTVPIVCALSYMEQTTSLVKYIPQNTVLMGGPIDTRESPTSVNDYAQTHDLNWFKSHVLYDVPFQYAGFGRKVYPGFLQHLGFISMNFNKHVNAKVQFFNHLIEGSEFDIKKHEEFYNEYNSVMDLPGKYYLETLENVFIDQKVAKGTLDIDGINIDLSKIKNTKILSLEGEFDDISGAGQTHSIKKLCPNVTKVKTVTIPKVGHYGLFSGKGWQTRVFPTILEFLEN